MHEIGGEVRFTDEVVFSSTSLLEHELAERGP